MWGWLAVEIIFYGYCNCHYDNSSDDNNEEEEEDTLTFTARCAEQCTQHKPARNVDKSGRPACNLSTLPNLPTTNVPNLATLRCAVFCRATKTTRAFDVTQWAS